MSRLHSGGSPLDEGATVDELLTAAGDEVATVLGVPTVTLDRYEPDGGTTVLAVSGASGFTVGSRWPLDGASLAATVLATGRPAQIDDYSELAGTIAAAVRDGRSSPPWVSRSWWTARSGD